MTIDIVLMLANKHKVGFLIIEDNAQYTGNEFPALFLEAPYMPENFIKDVEKSRPAVLDIRYSYPHGFFHWAAWKLRKRRSFVEPIFRVVT